MVTNELPVVNCNLLLDFNNGVIMHYKTSKTFGLIAELAVKRGYENPKHIGGCIEMDINDGWDVSINGYDIAIKNSKGFEVKALSAFISKNGLPMATLRVNSGFFAGDSEQLFIQAITKCLDS